MRVERPNTLLKDLTVAEAVKVIDYSNQESMGRYRLEMNRLLEHASEHNAIEGLIDAMTRTLALIAAAHSTPAPAGEIIRLLGSHLVDTVQVKQALEEADRAKLEGAHVH